MSAANVLALIKEQEVKFVDLRFTDTKGKEQHVSVPHHQIDEGFFEDGKMFDGSSIAGWKGINESDMVLMPDASTALLDPFTEETTLIIRCDILEPATMQGYDRDPRSIAKRAEGFLKSRSEEQTPFCSDRNRNSLFLMTFVSATPWAVLSSRLTPKKPLGTLLPNTKVVTRVTVLA